MDTRQIIDLIIETRDQSLLTTFCDKLRNDKGDRVPGGYSLLELNNLIDCITSNRDWILNHLIKHWDHSNYSPDPDNDPLVWQRWLNEATTRNDWKLAALCRVIPFEPLNLQPPPPSLSVDIPRLFRGSGDVGRWDVMVNGRSVKQVVLVAKQEQSTLLFLQRSNVLLELFDVQWEEDEEATWSCPDIDRGRSIWCLHGTLNLDNIKTIKWNKIRRYRISTSQSIVKINNNNTTGTQTQDSLIITKCNDNPIPCHKQVLNIAKLNPPKLKNNNNNNNNKRLKRNGVKKLNNVKPIVIIESSQVVGDNHPPIKQEKVHQIKQEKDHQIKQDDEITRQDDEITRQDDEIAIDKDDTSIMDNTTTLKHDDLINIHNPSINTHTITTPNDYTSFLQKQIQQSIDTFTNDLIYKIDLINHEVSDNMINPLTIKYQRRVKQLQIDFQNDTDSLIQNVKDLSTKLHWNSNDLIQYLHDRRAT